MDNHQSDQLQDELLQLQHDIKSDLISIPTLKMGIVPAKTYYGALLSFLLKLSSVLFAINLIIHMGLLAVLHKSSPMTLDVLFVLWCCTIGASVIVTLFLTQFILFRKLVNGRLKTEAFIKRKCRHFSKLFLLLYGVFYLIISFIERSDNWFPFSYILEQFLSTIPSLVAMALIINIEIERLSLGIVFDVIHAFMQRTNKPSMPVKAHK